MEMHEVICKCSSSILNWSFRMDNAYSIVTVFMKLFSIHKKDIWSITFSATAKDYTTDIFSSISYCCRNTAFGLIRFKGIGIKS